FGLLAHALGLRRDALVGLALEAADLIAQPASGAGACLLLDLGGAGTGRRTDRGRLLGGLLLRRLARALLGFRRATLRSGQALLEFAGALGGFALGRLQVLLQSHDLLDRALLGRLRRGRGSYPDALRGVLGARGAGLGARPGRRRRN